MTPTYRNMEAIEIGPHLKQDLDKISTLHRHFVGTGFWPSKTGTATSYSYPCSSKIDQSRVNWVTASELDGDTFETQRGADGILIESPFRYSSRWLFSSS